MLRSPVAVIPRPVSVVASGGVFELKPGTTVEPGPGADLLADAFSRGIRALFPSPPPAAPPGARAIHVAARTSAGHRVSVTTEGVRVDAATAEDAFHAAQTVRQLAPPATAAGTAGAVDLPCCEIEDRPRFAWRGLMLDVCRHFFGLDTLRRFVDLLALHKMNTLHLHLTEDQAWRVEILSHPRLVDHASWRTQPDGSEHGGYLSQAELRELVRYAADRFVTVVPEIEMPGHATAALRAHPQLSCTGGPFETPTIGGIYADIFCTKPEVFRFLEDVVGELLDVFPSPFFHVGGDEVPKQRWRSCPTCQDTIRREGLADEAELQSYFIRHFDRFLERNGRHLLGWDEILEGGLAEGAAVMSWRGTSGGIAAGQAGHAVVMSPHEHCYLDGYQADPETIAQPQAQPFVRSLRDVWTFDPVAPGLEAHADRVLGGQANLWTEYVETPEHLELMAFPRLCALAEAVWSPRERGSWEDFNGRLDVHLGRLDALGVNAFRGPRS